MQFDAQQQAAQRNLSYLLAEKLGQQILAGEYQAGSILPGEMDLAEQFGVSRTAVREAVKMLAAKGMLLPRPRIGTRVMPPARKRLPAVVRAALTASSTLLART